jgi:hypothetical protein
MKTLLRTECTFVVKEGADGKPSVVAEPTSSAGLISLELTEGASLAQAQEIALYLRRHVHAISIS